MTVQQQQHHWNYDFPNEFPTVAPTTTTTTTTTNHIVPSITTNTATSTTNTTTSTFDIIDMTDSSSFSFAFACHTPPTATVTTATSQTSRKNSNTSSSNSTLPPPSYYHPTTNVGPITTTAAKNTTAIVTNRNNTNHHSQNYPCKENIHHVMTHHPPTNHHHNHNHITYDVIDLTQSPSTPTPSPQTTTTTTNVATTLQKSFPIQPRQLLTSSSSSSSSSKICNPYQKRLTPTNPIVAMNHQKRSLDVALTSSSSHATTPDFIPFVGGAEMARQKARHDVMDQWKKKKKTLHHRPTTTKGPPTRILRPGETKASIQQQQEQTNNATNQAKQRLRFHKYTNLFERFFHSLLHWPIHEYLLAATVSSQSQQHQQQQPSKMTTGMHPNHHNADTVLWDKMCQALNLDLSHPSKMIQSTYPDLTAHCNIRTIVLVEEVRNTLCDSLQKILPSMTPLGPPRRPIPHDHHHKYSSHSNSSSSSSCIHMDVQVIAMEECGRNNNKKNNNNHHYHKHHHHSKDHCDPVAAIEPNHKIMVQSRKPFTHRELYNIRPSSVFLIRPRQLLPPSSSSASVGTNTVVHSPMVLGVVTTGNRDVVEKSHKFEMMIFQEFDLFASRIASSADATRYDAVSQLLTLTYVTQLVTEFRCYEALNTNYKINFDAQLIGHPEQLVTLPSPTHTRFKDEDDMNEDDRNGEDNNSNLIKRSPMNKDESQSISKDDVDSICRDYFILPELNKTQNDVATEFLQSPPNTITLVQGPPGTGKTTLLVSILCRYLIKSLVSKPSELEDKPSATIPSLDPAFNHRKCHGRIMVCAPTNKAVHVLASRFMKATMQRQSQNVDKGVSFNIILVGDADKIFMDDRSSNSGNKQNGNGTSRVKGTVAPAHKVPLCADQLALKSIYLNTWIPSIIDGYIRISALFSPKYSGTDTITTLLQLAKQLQLRLASSLSNLPPEFVKRMGTIVSTLQVLSTKNVKSLQSNNSIRKDVQKHIDELRKLPNDIVLDEVRCCYCLFHVL